LDHFSQKKTKNFFPPFSEIETVTGDFHKTPTKPNQIINCYCDRGVS